jgi:peptide/nickel transport system ATP-binding protein
MQAVIVNSLRAGFPTAGKRTLVDLSLAVEEGSVFGIVGPSGCGKSTLLRVLAGLHSDWTGDVELFGEPISPGRRFRPPLRRAVQMVFQDPYASLHPHHTVARALLEPLELLGVEDPRARMLQSLEEVGLPAAISTRYPHQLSGGERQRVAISRALVPRPGILLLDEPTSALDLATQAEILNLLQALRAAQSMTFVLVSHDMAVVAHLCDEAAVMADGRVARRLDRHALDRIGP